jgi:transmembrane sensor
VILGVLLLGSLSYFLIHRPDELQPISKIQPQPDVMPGGNKAILTLGDGTKIVLDAANNGAITKEGNVTVIKLEDGQLAYEPSTPNASESSVSYNTISTPKGGQYQLVLSDGTKVWLNAESSLMFPSEFVKSERKVELAGEGYFEVANDKTRPFLVTVNDMSVKVLGTHFNVSAYTDEKSIKTTLLEGSVEMRNNGKFVMLKPGEQGRLQVESKALQITRNVDLDETMAWKNNEFVFNETELKDAMRQLSRWYNIKIQYDDEMAPVYLYGSISRNKGLAEVLKIMETSGLKFKIERVGSENKLTIMKPNN